MVPVWCGVLWCLWCVGRLARLWSYSAASPRVFGSVVGSSGGRYNQDLGNMTVVQHVCSWHHYLSYEKGSVMVKNYE